MNGYWMLPVLLAGIYLAVKLTRWINYHTYGRNMDIQKGVNGKTGGDMKPKPDDKRYDR
jgi:hypothetical protein